MFFNKNKYVVENLGMIGDELIILLRDLETDEYIEITGDTLKNNVSETDKIIHKTVVKKLKRELFSNN